MIPHWHTFYARLHAWFDKVLHKSAGCRNGCEIFDLRQFSDVTPYERHMEEVQMGRSVKVQQTPIGSTIRCPKCRQRNYKVPTETYIYNLNHLFHRTGVDFKHWFANVCLCIIWPMIICIQENEEYIFCWACRIHYCSLCRIRVDDKYMNSLFIWLVADGWCWFVLRESTAGWLLVAGLFREKSTAGWWLISRTNGLEVRALPIVGVRGARQLLAPVPSHQFSIVQLRQEDPVASAQHSQHGLLA
jgi:hypothetical protein